MLVPPVCEQITSFESLRQVVIVQHRQSVSHAVDALESNPAIGLTLAKWRAQRICICRAQAVESGKPGLDYPVIAARLKRLLSLIHISEPTRLLSISYAVFCLK